eukprot:1160385-Pelagomonas_calceolata.AAC.6
MLAAFTYTWTGKRDVTSGSIQDVYTEEFSSGRSGTADRSGEASRWLLSVRPAVRGGMGACLEEMEQGGWRRPGRTYCAPENQDMSSGEARALAAAQEACINMKAKRVSEMEGGNYGNQKKRDANQKVYGNTQVDTGLGWPLITRKSTPVLGGHQAK